MSVDKYSVMIFNEKTGDCVGEFFATDLKMKLSQTKCTHILWEGLQNPYPRPTRIMKTYVFESGELNYIEYEK